jgi:enterobactin synthetase component D / holo-[acyl-carrier protein] synthase
VPGREDREVIHELLPPGVSAAEAFGDPPGARLFPEEEAAVLRAVTKRRREFTTARACARAALAQLGFPPAPIVPGPRGAPQWPPGVVGSITHCRGYRACAVARSQDVATIGLDAEPHGPLPDLVLGTIATSGEHVRLASLTAAAPAVSWDRLLFSAKESVYKAWFPLTHRWLGFGDAVIDIDPAAGTFTAQLAVDGLVVDGQALGQLSGRWLIRQGLIITAIVAARRPAAASPAGSAHPAAR